MSSEPAATRARILALHLPQYHAIPENDQWWGEGFTEWTNVRRAVPLFQGHQQPVVPGELGYYNLLDAEARAAQARLARAHGVEGFCYWHYWFGHGRRLLDRPIRAMLADGEPDMPFCLAWANESWTGVWHGAPDRVLVEQVYGGDVDHRKHFAELEPAFHDPRYVTLEGMPVFFVYRPLSLPEPNRFCELWRELAAQSGLPGLYLVGFFDELDEDPSEHGFDAKTSHFPGKIFGRMSVQDAATSGKTPRPRRYAYSRYARLMREQLEQHPDLIPIALPNWDNTPRSGIDGVVLEQSSPQAFAEHLADIVGMVEHLPADDRFVLLKSWNEWAEGNYVEPDQSQGRAWMEAIRNTVCTRPGGDPS